MNNAMQNARYHDTNTMIANDFSYHPIPYFEDRQAMTKNYSRKLDLNLYCIKRPQQTCFIRVTNPDMLAWGIEQDDMLVVEKNDSLSLGDLVVLEVAQQMEIYEFVNHNNGEFVFFPLSSKAHHIKTNNWAELPIIGTVTNTIHQIKPRKNSVKFAA
ncbi:LexA family protein [Lonepinella koalarum]|uniref:LexA family protein n=1 Tax=Lonepinella koalarum TaxID=53417 RepID=UPI003F6DFFFA